VTGLYVLYDNNPAGRRIVDVSEDQLLDHVVSVVAGAVGALTPPTADATVDELVGRPLEDADKWLILRRLLHCKGNRGKSAFALGLDEGVLRAKLRRYLLPEMRARDIPEELA